MSAGSLDDGMQTTVDAIMAAAREAATRAEEIETVAARRAHALRMAAEADAENVRGQAAQYVAASKRLVDEFARERMTRIEELSGRLLAQSTALAERLERADDVVRQLDELRAALGVAAERIAAEAAVEGPELPEPGRLHLVEDLDTADA